MTRPAGRAHPTRPYPEVTEMLDEHRFDLLADEMLRRLEASLGNLDPDDCDVTLSMGVLTLEFGDGSRFVINSHRAARQIWMAANSRAWHFSVDPDQDRWYGDRQGEDLVQTVEQVVSEKIGYPVRI
jgi:CyaY protein